MYECALSVSVSLSFACFDLSCWRCRGSGILGPGCTEFSGNAHNHNNSAVPCGEFGVLEVDENVHS